MIPQDGRGLVMLYGVSKDKKANKENDSYFDNNNSSCSRERAPRGSSKDNHFKRRSNSMQHYKKPMMRKGMSTKDTNLPKHLLSTTLFGMDTKRQQEIQSYKRDAINLIANRFNKKMREYFGILHDFAAFQEV